MQAGPNSAREGHLPSWLPPDVRHYVAHVAGGRSIRALAEAESVHPSTILRQVRRFETRRDDPLVDAALRTLVAHDAITPPVRKDAAPMNMPTRPLTPAKSDAAALSPEETDRALAGYLGRLSEPGAVMAFARDLEHAVIVREDKAGQPVRTASVPRLLAETMSLRDWIKCTDPAARIARYVITRAGRAAWRDLTAVTENRAQGLRAPLRDQDGGADRDGDTISRHAPENPLVGLARRRNRDGSHFLGRDLVAAGERLREDFELSAVTVREPETWRADFAAHLEGLPPATLRARDRVLSALNDLGPGLACVTLRCCCLHEGLESTEKTMGWSARSGKIVLRIALQRLVRHYAELSEADCMIG